MPACAPLLRAFDCRIVPRHMCDRAHVQKSLERSIDIFVTSLYSWRRFSQLPYPCFLTDQNHLCNVHKPEDASYAYRYIIKLLRLGNSDEEIRQTMMDCRSVGMDVITFGQYLRPTERHLSVVEYVTPEKFKQWKLEGQQMGFRYVASGPMVRSSYKAGEYFKEDMIRKGRMREQGL